MDDVNTMDKSLLLQTIGDTPANRILDFFIEGKGIDYTKSDVADGCGLSRPTVYKAMASLEKQGIVRKTRTIGRSRLYALNSEEARVKALLKLEVLLLQHSFEELERPRKATARASA